MITSGSTSSSQAALHPKLWGGLGLGLGLEVIVRAIGRLEVGVKVRIRARVRGTLLTCATVAIAWATQVSVRARVVVTERMQIGTEVGVPFRYAAWTPLRYGDCSLDT